MFDRLQAQATRAFDNISNAVGGNSDPDLDLYNTLTEDDFPKLIRRYGDDNVLEYIQLMEKKRLKGVQDD